MQVNIDPSWKPFLEKEFNKPYFEQLASFVKEEYRNHTIYPPARQIFSAFELSKFEAAKVVILGQDPYHGPKQANGLCFSVSKEVSIPPSLVNIFKEINQDLGISIPSNGDLSRWAQQGVLLLNATLTVRARQAGSHQHKGWETFTDAIISVLSDNKQHLVFLLWGNYAQKKEILIDTSKHLVLKSAHPSPYSADRGFFGNHHFSKTNAYLSEHGLMPINW
ncbi:MAG: uracil-DNA glycosylase [Candidatus Amoebophilus sp. 36-38]|nr:MAG: uracil-DNA glycosylase [Candidatus Amoebophilus sp. 36-38]